MRSKPSFGLQEISATSSRADYNSPKAAILHSAGTDPSGHLRSCVSAVQYHSDV